MINKHEIKKITVLSLISLILLATFSILAYKILLKSQETCFEKTNQLIVQANNNVEKGNFTETAEIYEKIKNTNCLGNRYIFSGKDMKNHITAFNSQGKRKETLLKNREIILSGRFNNKDKATAIQNLAETIRFFPYNFLEKEIFNGQAFERYFIPDDVYTTATNLYSMSNASERTDISSYALADWYAEKIIENKKEQFLDENKKSTYFGTLSGYIKDASVGAKDDSSDRVLMRLLNFSRLSDKLNELQLSFIKNVAPKEKIEELFKKSLELSLRPPLTLEPDHYEYTVRLYYASFLNHAYPGQRNEEIKTLLDPIYKCRENKDFGFFIFLQRIGNYWVNSYQRTELVELSKVDPKMKDLLKEAGWKDFQ